MIKKLKSYKTDLLRPGKITSKETIKMKCSICKEEGHRSNNTNFHPAESMSDSEIESMTAPLISEVVIPTIKNKGTGAGGAKTNVNGKSFEEKTDNETRLLSSGFIRKEIPGCKSTNKYGYYLIKVISRTESITYLTQSGLKAYFAHFFKKEMCRSPDEAYLFRKGDKYTLKILEKKNQNTAGSVDTKLLAGRGFIDEYELLLGEDFNIRYGFCISAFLKNDYIADCAKSRALRHINKKYGIDVLYGDDENYYETLDAWINS